MGQLIFPSNFFPVMKMIMKNNFYFEFFSAVPLLIFPLAHWKLWQRVRFFSVKRTWENLVRLFAEKEHFFFYPAFCLQFCITFLWKYSPSFLSNFFILFCYWKGCRWKGGTRNSLCQSALFIQWLYLLVSLKTYWAVPVPQFCTPTQSWLPCRPPVS